MHTLAAVVVGAGVGATAFGRERNSGEPASATGLWAARCAACHGENAGGVEGKVKSLLTDAAMEQDRDRPFFDLLKKGDGPHAGAGKGLSDEQAWAVIVHLREVQFRDWRSRNKGPREVGGVYTTQRAKFKVETVIDDDLHTPWSIEWLPAAPAVPGEAGHQATPPRVLVTELGRSDEKPPYPAGIVVYENGSRVGKVSGLPKIASRGQGGLMDAAAHPEYAKNGDSGWVYITCAEQQPGGRGEMTKVVRGKIASKEGGLAFTDQQVIFQPRHYNGAGVHYGSRIVFQKAPADAKDTAGKPAAGRYYVYFVVGERGGNMQAQRTDLPNGKVHRLFDDGAVPADNPFVGGGKEGGDAGAYPSIYTKGHRNPQGMCFDDQGTLWVTEHAPRGGDELNLLTKGANYGWPEACFGINYSDQPFVTPWKEKASDGTPITMPVYRWLPSIAACGLDCARAASVKSTFPDWSGDLFAGGLAANTLQRLRIKDGSLTEREEVFFGHGRVRDVAFGPDGLLYVVLNGPDKVVRLTPVE